MENMLSLCTALKTLVLHTRIHTNAQRERTDKCQPDHSEELRQIKNCARHLNFFSNAVPPAGMCYYIARLNVAFSIMFACY